MRNLVLLVVILTVGIALAGCQQAGLTEEQVRSIVREEVASQLAGAQVKEIVGQEVTGQLAILDNLVRQEVTKQLSNVDEIVAQEVNSQMAGVTNIVKQQVSSQLGSIDVLTVSQLQITNSEGKLVAMLTGRADGRGMLGLYDAEKGYIVTYLGVTADGNAVLNLSNSNGIVVATLGSSSVYDDDGVLHLNTSEGQRIASINGGEHGNGNIYLYNMYGDIVASMGASLSSDGVLSLSDMLGNFTFIAP